MSTVALFQSSKQAKVVLLSGAVSSGGDGLRHDLVMGRTGGGGLAADARNFSQMGLVL